MSDSTASSAFFRDANVDNGFAVNSATGQTLNIFGFAGLGNVLELNSLKVFWDGEVLSFNSIGSFCLLCR